MFIMIDSFKYLFKSNTQKFIQILNIGQNGI